MIIKKIEPQGFCGGVKRAIDIVNNLLDDNNVKKPIYMLGSLIHNNHIINDFKEKGVIILDDKLSKEEMINMVQSGTIIISAHGISPIVYQKAVDKGLNIVDTTCPYVELIHQRVTDALKNNKEVIYIGTKSHPEVCGVLGISNKIHLISSLDEINSLNLNSNDPYITNQTTLSIFDVDKYYELLKNRFINAKIDNKICNATTVRQEAVAKQDKVDLCIIVGDKKSSNTKKLASVAKEVAKINTILIDSVDDLKDISFKDITSISVSSGASTPEYLVNEVIEYLETIKS